jgi:uncharacterized membrane protein
MSLITDRISKLKLVGFRAPKLMAALDINLLAATFAAVTSHVISSGNMETTVVFFLAATAGLPRIAESYRESKKSGLRTLTGLSCITAAFTLSALVIGAL